LIDLESQTAGSEVPVGIEVQILIPAGFRYLQVLQRKARKSILPRTRLPLSSAFRVGGNVSHGSQKVVAPMLSFENKCRFVFA